MKFMEEKLVPVAAKIGSQRHLVAIRDAFIIVMPLTIAGSLAVLFNNFAGIFGDASGANPDFGLGMPDVAKTISDFLTNTKLRIVFGAVNNATLALMALLFVMCLGYNLANSRGVAGISAAVINIACFMGLIPTFAFADFHGWKPAFHSMFMDAEGLFVAMIVGMLATELFCWLSKLEALKVKLPDGVPPAVAGSFTILFPAMFTIFGVVGVGQIIQSVFEDNIWVMINNTIGEPLKNLTGSLFGMLVIIFFVHLLWIFGLHGANIVGAVTGPVLAPLGQENIQAYNNGETPPNTVTGGLFAAFAYLGGSGATIGLIIAIFLFSKSKAQRTVATIAVAPGLFEINEPLTFGLPIVLNPILAIPFILGPMILGTLTYFIMEAGIIRRVCVDVPWVTPPIIIGFLATGGDWKGAVWNVIEIALLTVLWTPFVIASSRMEVSE